MLRVGEEAVTTVDPNSAAARLLQSRMSSIARGVRRVNWLIDLEFELWSYVVEPCNPEERRQGRVLKKLAEMAKGWWMRSDEGSLKFVPLEEWAWQFQSHVSS